MRKLLRDVKSPRAFTLIEVMIVVSIIGLLASIAIPNFSAMQLKAKRSEVPLTLVGISVAQRAYYAEYGNYLSSLGYFPRDIDELDTKKVSWPSNAGGFTTIGFVPDGKLYGTYDAYAVGADYGGYDDDDYDEGPKGDGDYDDEYDDDRPYNGDYDYEEVPKDSAKQSFGSGYVIYGSCDVDNDDELAVYILDSDSYYYGYYGNGEPYYVGAYYYGHESY